MICVTTHFFKRETKTLGILHENWWTTLLLISSAFLLHSHCRESVLSCSHCGESVLLRSCCWHCDSLFLWYNIYYSNKQSLSYFYHWQTIFNLMVCFCCFQPVLIIITLCWQPVLHLQAHVHIICTDTWTYTTQHNTTQRTHNTTQHTHTHTHTHYTYTHMHTRTHICTLHTLSHSDAF